jgi:hypothetical protein
MCLEYWATSSPGMYEEGVDSTVDLTGTTGPETKAPLLKQNWTFPPKQQGKMWKVSEFPEGYSWQPCRWAKVPAAQGASGSRPERNAKPLLWVTVPT